ncbi:unnamed protein product [Clonostachys rhizophaga]|uniref:Tautomerase cis-CaaD-like domain-containing protein n=1 Tax=Clonostachys rhizophaga TaxID=160324 RepID=A0A9N9VBU2_9HYPO|nr:unnamed protein product [Clonostachys rhizophaga]
MPFYQIYYSCPLTQDQRQALAQSITDLHCAAFTTPSFFVHVKFLPQDAGDGTSFLAGKPTTLTSNRIIGILRISPARKKADFDALSAKIEDAWYEVVNGGTESVEQRRARHEMNPKRLLMVTLTPMMCIREGGMVLPEAGQEMGWLKDQLPYIKEMSQRGQEDFTEILQEIEERPDLQRLVA